jgi:hypothetical protein
LFSNEIGSSGSFEFNPSIKDGFYIVSLSFQNRRMSKVISFINQ